MKNGLRRKIDSTGLHKKIYSLKNPQHWFDYRGRGRTYGELSKDLPIFFNIEILVQKFLQREQNVFCV
jgi:hypothetical protein